MTAPSEDVCPFHADICCRVDGRRAGTARLERSALHDDRAASAVAPDSGRRISFGHDRQISGFGISAARRLDAAGIILVSRDDGIFDPLP